MAGQGGPVRRLPVDPFGFMLASLPAPGGPPLPQLPTIGPAPQAQIAPSADPPSIGRPSVSDELRARVQSAIDSGEFGQLALASGPAIARVPREQATAIMGRLMQSWANTGQQMPTAVEQALTTLARRFPRMLSHVESVRPIPPGASPGAMGQFVAAEDGVRRIGDILIDPTLEGAAVTNTLTHELTHGGQALRAADRGLEFQPLYSAQSQQRGYYNNPFEVRARIVENNQALRERNLLPDNQTRMQMARLWAGDQTLQGLPRVSGRGASDAIAKLEQALPRLETPGASALDIAPATADDFAAGIGTLNRKARANTSVYSPEELSQMQLYMVRGANAGYAIKNGDELVNVFNNGGLSTFGRAKEIVEDAVRRGARRLDCFDGRLVDLYESAGFKIVRREPNWTPGGPDVVFMEWTGGPTAAGAAAR